MGRALLVLETQNDKDKAVHWIGKAPVGTRVEFKASKRSLPQNDLMWAILTDIAQQLEHGGRKYDPSEWKCIFLHAFGREITFLPSLDNRTFLPIEMSSADLSKDEMTDFIEFIMKEGAERGVTFHIPKDTNPGDQSPPDQPEADDRTVSPDLGTTEPAAISPTPGAAAGSTSDYQKWLLNVSRMLWAIVVAGGDVELLGTQREAALEAFPKPDDLPKPIDEKAKAVYRRCREVIDGSLEQQDALALIAGNVGVDQDDILRKAGS